MTTGRTRWSVGAITLVVGLFLGACQTRDEDSGRVLLVGIDGASLRVVEPLLAEGRLPNLAALARNGVSGPLESILPLQSPRIWNSIATGKLPEKHGILEFSYADETGRHRLYLSSDRRVHALWNILSDAGRRVAVVNWWNTFPPERINGVMVSDHLLPGEVSGRRELTGAAPSPPGAVVFPVEWQQRISALLEGDVAPVAFADPFTDPTRLPHWILHTKRLSRRFREDAAIARIALEIVAETEPGLVMVLLPGIDRVSHQLWGVLEPPELYPEKLRPPPDRRAGGRTALESYYVYTDALIGELLRSFGPDDLVMVVSDHGFEAGVKLDLLTGVHESPRARHGLIFARGPGIPAGGTVQDMSVLDVTPTILAWLGLPVGEDMDGQVAAFLAVGNVARIPTHDTGPVERLESGPSGADEKLLDQLRALGYLE